MKTTNLKTLNKININISHCIRHNSNLSVIKLQKKMTWNLDMFQCPNTVCAQCMLYVQPQEGSADNSTHDSLCACECVFVLSVHTPPESVRCLSCHWFPWRRHFQTARRKVARLLLWVALREAAGRTQRTDARCPLHTRKNTYYNKCISMHTYFVFLLLERECRTEQAFPGRVDDGQIVTGASTDHEIKRPPLLNLQGNTWRKQRETSEMCPI